MGENAHAAEDILTKLHQTAEDQGHLTVGDIVEALGHRGWGPFLFIPAIIEISPIGGIPGVPTVLALIIAIFAAQIVAGREHMWLPRFLERRSVSAEKIRGATDKMRPVARWLDRWFHGRLPQLTGSTVRRAAAALALILCLTVPPLELLPFASTGPMAAIAIFGLAMMLRDGLLMAIGFAAAVAALGAGAWFLLANG